MRINADIRNNFLIEVVDANTGRVKKTVRSHNIILNNFFNLKNSPTGFSYREISFGSGTGTLDPTRTRLFKYEGMKDALTGGGDHIFEDHGDYFSTTMKVVIGTTEQNGKELTEVGFGTSTSMKTHSLFKDMNGNNISIVKTDTDVINIYATLIVYVNIRELSKNGFISRSLKKNDGLRLGLFDDFTMGPPSNNGNSYRYGLSNSLFPTTVGLSWYSTTVSGLSSGIKYSINRMPHTVYTADKGYTKILKHTGTTLTGCIRADYLDPYNIVDETIGTGDGSTEIFAPKIGNFYDPVVRVNGELTTAYEILRSDLKPIDWLTPVDSGGFLIFDDDVDTKDVGAQIFFNVPKIADLFKHVKYVTLHKLDSDYGMDMFWVKDGVETILPVTKNEDLHRGLIYDTTGVPSLFDGFIIRNTGSSKRVYTYFEYIGYTKEYGIKFNTPPNAGDVITMSYSTRRIPKNDTNVLDLSIEYLYNEYSG